ncbi:hypothetical protein CAPTEDRAFT_116010, partial [Capitella teleta]
MDQQVTNPILPVAGVHRNHAEDMSAGRTTSELRQHEDGSPNPLGRVSSDDGTHPKALLRCKKPFLMATFNANTVREEGRLRELAHCFSSNGISIMGIQEHRRVHDDPLVFTRVEGQHLITTSAWRNEAQAANGGVGMLLDSRARKSLQRATSHSERILVAEFDSNPVTIII